MLQNRSLRSYELRGRWRLTPLVLSCAAIGRPAPAVVFRQLRSFFIPANEKSCGISRGNGAIGIFFREQNHGLMLCYQRQRLAGMLGSVFSVRSFVSTGSEQLEVQLDSSECNRTYGFPGRPFSLPLRDYSVKRLNYSDCSVALLPFAPNGSWHD